MPILRWAPGDPAARLLRLRYVHRYDAAHPLALSAAGRLAGLRPDVSPMPGKDPRCRKGTRHFLSDRLQTPRPGEHAARQPDRPARSDEHPRATRTRRAHGAGSHSTSQRKLDPTNMHPHFLLGIVPLAFIT